MELRKFVAPEFVYGAGALARVGPYARNYGAKRALVVTDPGVMRAGWVEQALRSLDDEGVRWEVFEGVTPNPKDAEVAAGVRFYRAKECDVIIAIGGGSPMDCAKGIGVASANNMDVLEFEGVDEVPEPGPPLICIPTTAGSSADVSQFAIISDTARKLKIAIISKAVVPDVALIDPETTTTMSAELTAATGLDAVAHAVEAYVSNASSPITDLHAQAAIPLLVDNLVMAVENPDGMEYRHNMMLGSLLAGLAFSNASLGLLHAMAHGIGGLLGVPHGMCNALLLDHVIGFNYSAAAERYDRIAIDMGVDLTGLGPDQRKNALPERIGELREQAGITTTVGELGVSKRDIPRLAANAFNDPCLATNPRSASKQEIEELYEAAL
jgi:alcohol dehydrogenase class IV